MNTTPHLPSTFPSPTVASLMRIGLHTVRPGDTVAHAARLMLDRRLHALPVVEADGTPVGVFSLSDLVWHADRFTSTALPAPETGVREPPLGERPVRDLMTPDLFTVAPSDSLDDLLRFFAARGLHRALVVEDGRLVGLVSLADLLPLVAAPVDPRVPPA